MTLRSAAPHARSRWGLLAVVVAACTLALAAMSLGLSQTDFELDKNATNDLTTSHPGALKGSINSTVTSFTVCELTAPPANGSVIQIDAEQMTIVSTASTTGGTGGCSFASNEDTALRTRVWNVTRHTGGTTAAAHVGSVPRNNITLISSGSATGDDWDQVYAARPNFDCSSIGAVACVWKNRPTTGIANEANNFTGPTTFTGTSGDLQTIDQWLWTNQSVPEAAEINDAAAAKYGVAGAQKLYVAMDRTAVNGSKDIGFWFFKDDVGPNEDGTFHGVHMDGDILLLTTFSGGGATTTIRAYEWVGSGGSDGAVNFLGAFGDCAAGGNNPGCATTANTTVPSPWPHQEKPSGASANVFYAGGFMEGGLDLSALGLEGCFSSFMGTSRASPSLTAQPKAFILGQFESCDTELTTTPADANGDPLVDSDDNDVPDASIGTGTVDVTDSADLDVQGTETWSGTLDFYLCGPGSTTGCDPADGVLIDSQDVDQDTQQPIVSAAATISSAGTYCWAGIFTSDTTSPPDAADTSAGECFEVLPVTPTISTDSTDTVIVGNPLDDVATLGGTASQPGDPVIDPTTPGDPAGGTITFSLYGPSDTPVCTAENLIGTSVVDVSGDGTYNASDSTPTGTFTPTAVGTYYWVAAYSGNLPNTLDVSGACGDDNETSTVTGTASLSTAQDWLPNDTATLTGDTNLNGTLTFNLYNDASCGEDGGTSQYDEEITVTDAASGSEFSTSNESVKVEATGDYSWLVSYDDTTLEDPEDSCEVTNITITN